MKYILRFWKWLKQVNVMSKYVAMFLMLVFFHASFAGVGNDFLMRFKLQTRELEAIAEAFANRIMSDAYELASQDEFYLLNNRDYEISGEKSKDLIQDYKHSFKLFWDEISNIRIKQNEINIQIASYASFLSHKIQGGEQVEYLYDFLRSLEKNTINKQEKMFFKVLASFIFYKFETPYLNISEKMSQFIVKEQKNMTFSHNTILYFPKTKNRLWGASRLLADRLHSLTNSFDFTSDYDSSFYTVFPIVYELYFLSKGNEAKRWYFSNSVARLLHQEDISNRELYDPNSFILSTEQSLVLRGFLVNKHFMKEFIRIIHKIDKKQEKRYIQNLQWIVWGITDFFNL